MKNILILFFFISINGISQTLGMDEINSSDLHSWSTDKIKDYSGTYSFGYSESESELRIFVSDGLICVQIMNYEWSEKFGGFIPNYENLENVKIIGNHFYSNKSNGEFMEYKTDKSFSVGLLVENPWSYGGQNEPEFGQRYPDEKIYLPGNFTQASTQVLTTDSLILLNLKELKIMRNEIFARYNYKFKIGGEMDEYFSNKKWYHRINDRVDNWMTEIEKINIRLIKQVELEKNGL